jgi:hypothetical protein
VTLDGSPVADRLVVHTRTGVVEVRLTGDARLDATLERFARRGGNAVVRAGALVEGEGDAVVRGAPDDS